MSMAKKSLIFGALMWCCSIVIAQSKPQVDLQAKLLASLPQPPQENVVPMMKMPGMPAMPMAAMPPKQQLMSFSGSGSSTISFGDHSTTCSSQTGGGNVDCFHSAITGTMAKVFSGNGATYGIDSSNNGYEFNDYGSSNPNTWTEHPEWGTVYGLGADSNGNIYAMTTQEDSYCATIGGGHAIGEWNGSGWDLVTYCFNQMEVGPHGYLLTIDPNGTLWWNEGGAWVHAPLPAGHFPAISASWIDDGGSNFLVVTHDNQVWAYVSGSFTQPTNGTCCAHLIVYDGHGEWYVTGTDDKLYHYNGNGFDGPMVGPGTLTALTAGDAMHVFAVGPTNNGKNVYRFNTVALSHTRYFGGTVSCTQGNNPLCTNATHTVTLQAALGSTWGQQNQAMCDGPCSTSAIASVQMDDLFTCFEDASACTPSSSGSFECSVAGDLGNDSTSFSTPKFETAYGRAQFRGTSGTFNWRHLQYGFNPIYDECVSPYADDGMALDVASSDWMYSFDKNVKTWDYAIWLVSFTADSEGNYHHPWYKLQPLSGAPATTYDTDQGTRYSCTTNW